MTIDMNLKRAGARKVKGNQFIDNPTPACIILEAVLTPADIGIHWWPKALELRVSRVSGMCINLRPTCTLCVIPVFLLI